MPHLHRFHEMERAAMRLTALVGYRGGFPVISMKLFMEG